MYLNLNILIALELVVVISILAYPCQPLSDDFIRQKAVRNQPLRYSRVKRSTSSLQLPGCFKWKDKNEEWKTI